MDNEDVWWIQWAFMYVEDSSLKRLYVEARSAGAPIGIGIKMLERFRKKQLSLRNVSEVE